MIISMAWTTNAYLQRHKRCTRRMWSDRYLALWQKAWDEGRLYHAVYDRSPRNDGRQIGTLRLTCRPYREPLSEMPEEDIVAEGGLWSSKSEFTEMFEEQYAGVNLVPVVVRFEPLPFDTEKTQNDPGGDPRQIKLSL